MSLATYNRKRDFKATPEPQGKTGPSKGRSFVVQKHAARRLHYDFRLEVDGVLKSWAVTKGPSLVPAEKRLAVHVEDHPLDYGGFEGTIPAGHYGAGEVIVWDRGTWQPEGDIRKALKKGHIEFTLDGEKLKGRWHLVRMQTREESRENWLLIKSDDEFARQEDDPDILEELPLSVVSDRSIDDLAGGRKTREIGKGKGPTKAKAAGSRTKVKAALPGSTRGLLPDFIEPQLAKLVKSAPTGPGWLHEIKLDGYRLQVRIERGDVRFLTRGGLDWTDRFGRDLVSAFADLDVEEALIDGEVVVENGSGISDFSLLQKDLSEGKLDRFAFYAFDLIYLDGFDLRRVELTKRKERLRALLGKAKAPLRYSEEFEESGKLVLQHACRLSLEGIISKRTGGIYKSGRGNDWVKSKCSARQELVIGGYAPSSVDPSAIGSLVMGVFEKDGKLRHVGRVGTGYSQAVARDLFERLQPLRQDKSPFANRLTGLERRDVQFVSPECVAEVEFRGWTADQHLRHASFRGLREDKPAKAVVREKPVSEKTEMPKRTVPLTHPERIYWPDAGVTKEGLASHYELVWPRIAPFIVDRPLALLRCPEGIEGQSFFQKHSWRGMRKEILRFKDPKDKNGEDYVGIRDLDGLIALVQGAALEIHPWGSTFSAIESPDMVIMDLDPGPGVDWQAVIDAAIEVRERFERIGLTGFLKTSGGKGLHVVAPLERKARWATVKAAMKALADAMAKDDPERYVSTVSKAKRNGRILIDYLRNGRGSTAVAPYSTRARPGAPVSTPLAWDELTPDIGPAHFTVDNLPARLDAQESDPWADFRASAAPITSESKAKAAKSGG
ncbi:DNA ligase D [Ciceribacter sp. L1K23]|uniref:DNA ligase D n=1 Tax=Ciceribacter sp. L1K23 TaxID=2820276 RepID=UPI001B80F7B3|nr:DNA ligase D [Ciceribacter sp. L1K23]MBR0557951.1 DNA ligase D [Ciceribacter sp. L1K23]